jgi:hypothetical protein
LNYQELNGSSSARAVRRGSVVTFIWEKEFREKLSISLLIASCAVLVSIIEGKSLIEIADQSQNLFFSGLGAAVMSFFAFKSIVGLPEIQLKEFFRTLLYGTVLLFFFLILILALPKIGAMLAPQTGPGFLNILILLLRNFLGFFSLIVGMVVARAFEG